MFLRRYFLFFIIILTSLIGAGLLLLRNNISLSVLSRPEPAASATRPAGEPLAEKNQATTSRSFIASSAPEILPPLAETKKEIEATATSPIKFILYDAPFTPQAPLGNWRDPRQQDGCEEAAALMAVRWARGEGKISPGEAEKEILAISFYEEKEYGVSRDTSASTTVERIIKGYFGYAGAEAKEDVSLADIKTELARGNLVILPLDGRKLKNPFYTSPGPERHMLLLRGYDPEKKEFIVNDAGTRRGEAYRYDEVIVYQAMRDYPTGDHEPISGEKKTMIIVRPEADGSQAVRR